MCAFVIRKYFNYSIHPAATHFLQNICRYSSVQLVYALCIIFVYIVLAQRHDTHTHTHKLCSAWLVANFHAACSTERAISVHICARYYTLYAVAVQRNVLDPCHVMCVLRVYMRTKRHFVFTCGADLYKSRGQNSPVSEGILFNIWSVRESMSVKQTAIGLQILERVLHDEMIME